MLAEFVIAVTLFVGPEPMEKSPPPQLSSLEKAAKVATFVRATTDCIINAVKKDPRNVIPESNLVDMIQAAFAGPCRITALHMVTEYDDYFGYGRGEKFFIGPYLDALPKAVQDAREKATGLPP